MHQGFIRSVPMAANCLARTTAHTSRRQDRQPAIARHDIGPDGHWAARMLARRPSRPRPSCRQLIPHVRAKFRPRAPRPFVCSSISANIGGGRIASGGRQRSPRNADPPSCSAEAPRTKSVRAKARKATYAQRGRSDNTTTSIKKRISQCRRDRTETRGRACQLLC